jgi:hypothetical protein
MNRPFWLSACLACVLMACGGGASPEVYAVSVDFFKVPDSCFANATPPPTVISAGSPTSAQLQVWDGPDGKAYMEIEQGGRNIDLGSAPDVALTGTLEGTTGPGGWVFTTLRTSVAKPPNGTTTTTENSKGTVTIERSSGPMKGTLKLESTRVCEGTGCAATFAAANPPCTVDGIVIRGTRVAVSYQRPP